MSTSYYAPQATPYRPITNPTATNPIGFNNSGDARVASRNQRQLVQGSGDALMANDANLADQYRQQGQGVEDYLNPIENQMATGGGGYSPEETAAIQFGPQAQQALIDKAGISAGVQTASGVGAAERAAAAGGGSPAALATYRARAAQQGGAAAGDAMTGARVAAKQLESAGAQTTGNARLGQQNTALNYYQGLDQQKNSNAMGEQGLQQGAYGTQTSGTGAATGDVLKASQTPSGWDKAIGFGAGALGAFASKLADGTPGYFHDGGFDAVLGEDGPEAVIEGASDPVRSHTRFMAGGGMGFGENADLPSGSPGYDSSMAPAVNKPNFLASYLQENAQQANKPQPSGGGQGGSWNPTTPYSQLGSALGGIAGNVASSGGEEEDDGGGGGDDGGSDMMADGTMGLGANADLPSGNAGYNPSMAPAVNSISPLRDYLQKSMAQSASGTPSGGGGKDAWNPTTPYQQLGSALGGGLSKLTTPEANGTPGDGSSFDAMPPARGYRAGRFGSRPRPDNWPNARRSGGYMADGDTGDGDGGTADMMAGGGFGSMRAGLSDTRQVTNYRPHPAMPPKIITAPTRVHLAKGDAVVPLSYRPNAKIRPSALMGAM